MLEGISSGSWEGRLLGGVGEAARWLLRPLGIVSLRQRLWLLGLLVDAVFVVLVVAAPIVAVVGVLLRLDPFLRFGTVDIGLERHRLAGGEGRRGPIANTSQFRTAGDMRVQRWYVQRRPGFLLLEAEGARHDGVGGSGDG